MTLDLQKIRADFPILSETIHGKPLVFLDNAASNHKPLAVINAINDAYLHYNSNIHRGVHTLSNRMTDAYETARRTVARFIGAEHEREIIFTKGTTESINLLAFSFGERYVSEGDEIIVSEMEHHANIVPWQMLCERKRAVLKVIPITDSGELRMDEYRNLLSERTRLVAVTQVSNVLGTQNPVAEIIAHAHALNIPVMIDGAQGVPHQPINVRELDCDFYAFSGHKLYAPTGIGVLYGKEKYLNEIPPYQGGGDMIKSVSFAKTVYNELPFKFEAGTTHYVGAVGLCAAIEYLEAIGMANISEHEHQLTTYATEKLSAIEGLTIYGTAPHKSSVISFNLKGIHHFDAGMILDKLGIAVRTGTHCAEPLMQHFGLQGTIRVAFALYNSQEEIDVLEAALRRIVAMF